MIKQIRFCDIKTLSWIGDITNSILWYHKFEFVILQNRFRDSEKSSSFCDIKKIVLWYQKYNLWYQTYWVYSKTAPHTGPTFCPSWYGSKPSDTLIIFLKDSLQNIYLKSQQSTTKHEKLPTCKELTTDVILLCSTCENHMLSFFCYDSRTH